MPAMQIYAEVRLSHGNRKEKLALAVAHRISTESAGYSEVANANGPAAPALF